MTWTTKKGINFRDTSAYVADNSGETYLDGDGSFNLRAYPVSKTLDGDTFNIGWSAGGGDDGSRDRDSGVDARLAGMHFSGSGGVKTFKMQAGSAAGNYKIWAGFTDQGNGTGGTVGFTIRDSNGTIISQTGLTALGSTEVYDVNGNLYASDSAWAGAADGAGIAYTFTTSDTTNGNGGPFIYIDIPDANARLAHFAIQYLGAGGSSTIQNIMHHRQQMAQ